MCAVAVAVSSMEEQSTTLRNISLLFVDLLQTRNSDISLKMFLVFAALTGKYTVGQIDSSFSLGTLLDSMDFISVFAQMRINVEGT